MRLTDEQQRMYDLKQLQNRHMQMEEKKITEERMKITGEPIREEYLNRKLYRTAYSKWRRNQ